MRLYRHSVSEGYADWLRSGVGRRLVCVVARSHNVRRPAVLIVNSVEEPSKGRMALISMSFLFTLGTICGCSRDSGDSSRLFVKCGGHRGWDVTKYGAAA